MDITDFPLLDPQPIGIPDWAEVRRGPDSNGVETTIFADKAHTAHVDGHGSPSIQAMRSQLGAFLFNQKHPGKMERMFRDRVTDPNSWADLWEEYRSLSGIKAA